MTVFTNELTEETKTVAEAPVSLPLATVVEADADGAGSPAEQESARTWSDDLLHTEVAHDGDCYVARVGWAVLLAQPGALVAAWAYAAGERMAHGGLRAVVGGADEANGHIGLVAMLAVATLAAAAMTVWHWLWHRAEAPYIHNRVLTGEEAEAHLRAYRERVGVPNGD